MAPKRHGGPAQPAGKGYVKSGRPGESAGIRTSGAHPAAKKPSAERAAGRCSVRGGERRAFATGFDISQFAAGTGRRLDADGTRCRSPRRNPNPCSRWLPKRCITAFRQPGSALPATIEAAPAVARGRRLRFRQPDRQRGGRTRARQHPRWRMVVIGLGAALGAWHSVALANNYLSGDDTGPSGAGRASRRPRHSFCFAHAGAGASVYRPWAARRRSAWCRSSIRAVRSGLAKTPCPIFAKLAALAESGGAVQGRRPLRAVRSQHGRDGRL